MNAIKFQSRPEVRGRDPQQILFQFEEHYTQPWKLTPKTDLGILDFQVRHLL